MTDPKYAAFTALDPFFDIVQQGLAGLVDGYHYFDTIADDAEFEFRYHFPGWPQTLFCVTSSVSSCAITLSERLSAKIPRVTKTSNHAIQRTAGSLGSAPFMKFHLQLAARRPLASRR